MRKMIASLLVTAFAIASAGSAFANGGCLHGGDAAAQSAVPSTVAATPTDTTTKTKTEPGTGG
jgi:hypothetical protein